MTRTTSLRALKGALQLKNLTLILKIAESLLSDNRDVACEYILHTQDKILVHHAQQFDLSL